MYQKYHVLAVSALSLLIALHANAQSTGQGADDLLYTYTSFTIADANDSSPAVIAASISNLAESLNGSIYALWSPTTLAEDAPFKGLTKNRYIAMLSFTNDVLISSKLVDSLLEEETLIAESSTKLYSSIELRVRELLSTPDGFYVHRDEHYRVEHMDAAVSLSRRAWATWEDYWQVKVVGLFREIDEDADIAKLNRIVWYPSYEHWQATRNNTDTQSRDRFRERRQLLIDGSGVAVATNRF
jgi:hypothetical protein